MRRTSSVSRSAAVHYYTRTNASNHEPRGTNCTPGVQEALGRLLMGQDCSLLPKGCARQPRGATAIPGDQGVQGKGQWQRGPSRSPQGMGKVLVGALCTQEDPRPCIYLSSYLKCCCCRS